MDLATLWYLTLGTLLVAAAMTLWEREALAHRSRELGLWAAACLVFALGCIVGMNRTMLPGVAGPALTNVVMVLGYILVLHGALALDGRRLPTALVAGLLAAVAAIWSVAGAGFGSLFWNHVAAFPIAAICALTALTLFRSRTAKALRTRPIAVAVFAGHSLFYGFRTFVTPVLAALHGDGVLPMVAQVTMYEAVLFSVAMPMCFLALVREEDRARLLAATRTDFLTGLLNRQGFFESAAGRLKQARAGGSHVLLAFDLDHFKTINDTYGHEAGDRVLKLFAATVAGIAGPGATSARLGGEEFAILLPDTGQEGARTIGQDIARSFAEMSARSDGLGIPATVSIGLAEATDKETDLAELLAKGDRALYRAKTLGRDRLEIARHEASARAA